MKLKILLMLAIGISALSACHHVTKDVLVENSSPMRIGAVYISCDSPPWKFNTDGLLNCEQDTPATLELNPANACAFESIANENGSISITFSNDVQLGRIHVIKLKDDVDLKNQNNESVSELYINETDHFFIEQGGVQLKVTVKNAYIGGCFHELIQWEETP